MNGEFLGGFVTGAFVGIIIGAAIMAMYFWACTQIRKSEQEKELYIKGNGK